MLHKVINAHARAILKVFQLQLQRGPTRNVFSPQGKVVLDYHGLYFRFGCEKRSEIIQADTTSFVYIYVRMKSFSFQSTSELVV